MKIRTETLDIAPSFEVRSICSPEEMLLFDIETTGLKKETTQLYLIGCAFYEDGQWKIRQWLTERTADEELVLEFFMDFASRFSTLVHFNGEGFDLPYLAYKAQLYGTGNSLSSLKSFDIYKEVRKARALMGLSGLSQKSIEGFLHIQRDDQMNGGTLIPVYYDYERTGSTASQELLLLHNFDDLKGMLRILPALSYPAILEERYEFRQMLREGDSVRFEYLLRFPVPVPVRACAGWWEERDIGIEAEKDLLTIRVPLKETTGKIPLTPVSDYYYLPEEDRVIHKDVAVFVDRSRRRKAVRKNCFLKQTGVFLPAGHFDGGLLYQMDDAPGQTFALWEEFREKVSRKTLLRYARDMLDRIS